MSRSSKEEMNKYNAEDSLSVATQKAIDNFNNLTDEQFERLKKLEKHLRWHRISHKPINKKILPLFYDLGLFVYDDSIKFIKIGCPEPIRILWSDGIAWLMTLCVKPKGHPYHQVYNYQKPDLATTMQLITSVLRARPFYGADFWYSKGITRKLITHLVKFKEEKINK